MSRLLCLLSVWFLMGPGDLFPTLAHAEVVEEEETEAGIAAKDPRSLDSLLSDSAQSVGTKVYAIRRIGRFERGFVLNGTRNYSSGFDRDEYIAVLFKHVSNPDPEVSSSCRNILQGDLQDLPLPDGAKYPSREEVQTLIRGDETVSFTDEALPYLPYALLLAFETEGQAILERLIFSPDSVPKAIRRAAVQAFVVYEARHPELAHHLPELISDEDDFVRAAGVAAYRWTDREKLDVIPNGVLEATRRLSRNGRPPGYRQAATLALGNASWTLKFAKELGTDPAFDISLVFILERLEDADPIVQVAAAKAIALSLPAGKRVSEPLARALVAAKGKGTLQRQIVQTLDRCAKTSVAAKELLAKGLTPETDVEVGRSIVEVLAAKRAPSTLALYLTFVETLKGLSRTPNTPEREEVAKLQQAFFEKVIAQFAARMNINARFTGTESNRIFSKFEKLARESNDDLVVRAAIIGMAMAAGPDEAQMAAIGSFRELRFSHAVIAEAKTAFTRARKRHFNSQKDKERKEKGKLVAEVPTSRTGREKSPLRAAATAPVHKTISDPIMALLVDPSGDDDLRSAAADRMLANVGAYQLETADFIHAMVGIIEDSEGSTELQIKAAHLLLRASGCLLAMRESNRSVFREVAGLVLVPHSDPTVATILEELQPVLRDPRKTSESLARVEETLCARLIEEAARRKKD